MRLTGGDSYNHLPNPIEKSVCNSKDGEVISNAVHPLVMVLHKQDKIQFCHIR